MNVLILTDSFPPEIKSSAHLLFELSEDLTKKGYRITVVTGFPKYYLSGIDNKYKGKLFLNERMNGVKIIRLFNISFLRYIPIISDILIKILLFNKPKSITL